MKKLTHDQIILRQEKLREEKKLEFVVLLNDIRSLHNVGTIFRTSDGVGIKKIYICGITGCPPSNRIAKSALGSEDIVEWEYIKNPKEAIKLLKKEGYEITFLEQMDESVDYANYNPQGPVCLVLGNEVDGISDEIVDCCDRAIEIEMAGLKNSLNVGVAFGIVAYHIQSSLKKNE
jgi:tRNA G18 (ribose-2'-O)-methylase SpoU